MKSAHRFLIGGILLLVVGLSLAAASPGAAQSATQAPTQAATPAATAAATRGPTPQPITEPLGKPPTFLLKYYQAWSKSGHAKADAEAFIHWNKEGAVPAGCATCHSPSGYVDYIGDDASAAGKVEKEAPIGGVVNCDACHTPGANALKTVAFPSGAKLGDIGDSTRCIVCHQGRSSTVQVNAAIEKQGLTKEPNKVDPKLGFINVHYYAAAASLYGSEAQGGYQFAGKLYQGRNQHVVGYNTCASCHDSHTLEVKVKDCATCHTDVKEAKDLKAIRMQSSLVDFDGDGNIKEGIASEIETMQEMLYKSMQAYATKVSGAGILYDSATYPYWFTDTNKNGKADEGEVKAENSFKGFTASLLGAAYNYQVSKKDPGIYAHNPKYAIQLLYDSIEVLNKELGGDVSKIERNGPGHFNASGEPFRHWDKEGIVPGSCAKCHTAEGLPVFLSNNANINTKPSNSLACTTCHDNVGKFTVYPSESVTFPSGAKLAFGKRDKDNLCLNCHQGRESTVSVNNAIKASGATADQVTDKLAFRNVHYFAAGASIFGDDAKGAYQYDGKQYSGRFDHDKDFQTCNDCHDVHALKVQFDKCVDCHKTAKTPQDIRSEDDKVDYNGNGKSDEPILAEITSLQDELLKSIYAYATKTAGASIVYAPANHPYWFVDLNNNGKVDPDEIKAENNFKKWTPNLLRAAYNYQYISKDPGIFAHNSRYALQVLYDSIESVGGKEAVAKFKRPEAAAKK